MLSSEARYLFWRNALLLGTSLLLLAGAAEWRLRRQPTLYHQKRDGLRAASPSAQVLVLGASQANQGLDPGLWPVPGYNAACVGQDAYYDAELLKAWLPRLPQLKALVLPISYVSFGSSIADTPEIWRSFAYSEAFGVRNEVPALRWDLRNWSALALKEPWPALQLAWQGFADPMTVSLTAAGFQPTDGPDADSLDLMINGLTAAKRANYHESIIREDNWALNRGRYERMLDLARERKVSVALVVFPVYRGYAKAVDPAVLKRRDLTMRALAQSGRARLYDYFRDERFGDKDFMDVDHLNKDGAKKFSRILWDEALKASFN